MTVKIFAGAATMLLNLAVAVVILFALLLALNGYSESDAMWGLVAFAVLAIAVTILSGVTALALIRFLSKRNYRRPSSGLVSIILASLLGTALQVGACIVSVLITEVVRTNLKR